MLKTALLSLVMSLVIFVLGWVGVAGVPLEVGRIVAMLVLSLSALFLGGQLIFGRHPDAL